MIIITDLIQVEQQIQRYHMIFWICFITGALCILFAAIMFFIFHIPKIVGELSGETARKKIRELEKANENPYQRKHDRLFDTGKGISWDMNNQTVRQVADDEDDEEDQKTQILDPGNQTTVLPGTRTEMLEVPEL